ncbi:hypothetical protein M422DRAFT_26071 [Sphaerobolus stellatus SS14]|nr:hypothetical protein M422DRAFT_26071 [Sphaerobolus stellatus SS14]
MPTKTPIQFLPLPPKAQLLTHNLTPDPFTPDADTFHNDIQKNKPSLQRRARLLNGSAHFSFVAPLPYSFPYKIVVEEGLNQEERTKAVEGWLSAKEASEEVDLRSGKETTLKVFGSGGRIKEYYLIGVARRGVEECLPDLDVGDAYEYIGKPALSAKTRDALNNSILNPNANKDGEVEIIAPKPSQPANEDVKDDIARSAQIRQTFTDIVAGNTVLIDSSKERGYAPWSLRYSGHQFGNWAGQLGDGRAISILEVPHPNDVNLTYELQLKGAGRTPFSRGADGLAVLRSSIREYLGAEAINALGIPTTRSLSLVVYPTLPVHRESVIPEKAAIATRMAPSFIRIGNFQGVSSPPKEYAVGFTGQQEPDYEALRILGEYVSRKVLQLKLSGVEGKSAPWGKELVLEVARRNGRMVAGWQVYGFMHGVMNTDNISILGLTIDYGPYAFMDVFDENHICNHTDEEGRYAYKYQPTMIIYAIRALWAALAPLIGAELELGHAVEPGWAENVSKEKIDEWRQDAIELQQEAADVVMQAFQEEYWALLRKRFGLLKTSQSDSNHVIRPFLRLLEAHELDFHSSFRLLSTFRPSISSIDKFVSILVPESQIPSQQRRETAENAVREWLEVYKRRVEEEKHEWVKEASGEDWEKRREEDMQKANPRFVLRQWVLEEVIKKVEEDWESGKRVLAKTLDMASSPFNKWGAEDDPRADEELDEESREERRYCGMGPKRFIGFQCSCSS